MRNETLRVGASAADLLQLGTDSGHDSSAALTTLRRRRRTECRRCRCYVAGRHAGLQGKMDGIDTMATAVRVLEAAVRGYFSPAGFT